MVFLVQIVISSDLFSTKNNVMVLTMMVALRRIFRPCLKHLNNGVKKNTIIVDDSNDKVDAYPKNVIILDSFECNKYSKSIVEQQNEFFETLINLE